MRIDSLENSDFGKYFQLAKEYGTIFNSSEWLSLFGDRVRILGIYNDKNDLIGGFHLYTEKKLGLTVCRNAPFTTHCGPFLKVSARNHVAVMDMWKKALRCMAEYIEDMRIAVLSIALDTAVVDTQPFIWKKNKVMPRYTYIIDLNLSMDAILENMSSERRNDLRKGEKTGISVNMNADYRIVQSLVNQSFSRQNMVVNNKYLEDILFRFADSNNSFAYVAEDDNRPIAAAFCIYDRRTAYYLLGGYAHENRHRSAGPLVCLEAIKHAQRIGLKTFDFEGSMIPRVESYFRGFGGKITPYYMINKAILPIEIILKCLKREFF